MSVYGQGRAPSVSSAQGPIHRMQLQQADVHFQLVIRLLFLSTSQHIAIRTLIETFVQTAAPMKVKDSFNNSNYSKNSNTSQNKQRFVCWQKWLSFISWSIHYYVTVANTQKSYFYVYYDYCGFLEWTMGRITRLTTSLWCSHRIINT